MTSEPAARSGGASRASVAWTSIVVAIVLLVLVVIFVVQNTTKATITFLAWHAHLPVAAALLIALVLGAAIAVAVGAARIHELRGRLRRTRH